MNKQFIARCYLHLWWYFSHLSLSPYWYILIPLLWWRHESVNGLFQFRIVKHFQIITCIIWKYLRPTLCLNKYLILPKLSVLINLGTNDKFLGKFSELWQRYEQIEPFAPEATNIKQEPNVLYSNRYWWKCHLALTAKLKTRPKGLGRSWY